MAVWWYSEVFVFKCLLKEFAEGDFVRGKEKLCICP